MLQNLIVYLGWPCHAYQLPSDNEYIRLMKLSECPCTILRGIQAG